MNKEKYKVKFAENLMSHQVMIPQVFTAGYDVIDEICSDYESRTCSNCIFYQESRNIPNYGVCDNKCCKCIYGVNKDFGCNKFERMKDGL